MAQYGVTVSRDDSEPSVLGSARTEASVYLGASGDLRAETHTLSSLRTPTNRLRATRDETCSDTSLRTHPDNFFETIL